MLCPKENCNYESSEHGVKTHLGRKHEANKETCEQCGKVFKRPPAKVDGEDNCFCSVECKNSYRTGNSNPNYSEKEKVICSYCAEEDERIPSLVNRGQERYYCDNICQQKHWHELGIQSGEDNPMYGGEGSDWRSRTEWLSIREEVLSDQEKCLKCGSSKNLHVHHNIPVFAGGEKYEKRNLTTLCQNCHYQVHRYIDAIFSDKSKN
jgi:hypothetical protein